MLNDNNIEVVKETEDWVAINKPHGLHVLPDRYDSSIPTVLSLMQEPYKKLYVVHRLDSGTGGILILAKNALAHRYLCTQMENRAVEREYLAIVKGNFTAPITIMLPISTRNQNGKYKINFKSGKCAQTTFIPLKQGEGATLVKARIFTGRTHQIRVHLRAHGFPLVNDWLYGAKSEDRRLSLFANYVKLIDKCGTNVILSAEPSFYMTTILKKFNILKDIACNSK